VLDDPEDAAIPLAASSPHVRQAQVMAEQRTQPGAIQDQRRAMEDKP